MDPGALLNPGMAGTVVALSIAVVALWRERATAQKACAKCRAAYDAALAAARREHLDELRALVPIVERAARGDEQAAEALAEVRATLARWEKLLPTVAQFAEAMR